jgi:hypothetical protein
VRPSGTLGRVDASTAALVAELGRKTSVCWLRYGGEDRPRPAWHVWHDGGLLLVSGGEEQQLPGFADAGRVEVTMRSKEDGGRLVTWVGAATTVQPDDETWAQATTALAAARLSIPSLTETPRQWARTATVTRVVPTGEVLEAPGSLSDSDHAAPPAPTPATTRGPLPRVLHRRQRRRPPLS